MFHRVGWQFSSLAMVGFLFTGVGLPGCGSDTLTGVDRGSNPQEEPSDPCEGMDVCDDGDPCTQNDTCIDGECRGEVYTCDDEDICTVDTCVGDGTCTHANDDIKCPPDIPPETTTWTGYYDCPGAQGKTGLDLTTTRDEETDEMTAIFSFYPLPENPHIPEGSWLDEGYYDPGDNSMRLLPVEWIDRPFGWVMVGMEGWYDGPQQQVHGNILMSDGSRNPFCETFHLRRVP